MSLGAAAVRLLSLQGESYGRSPAREVHGRSVARVFPSFSLSGQRGSLQGEYLFTAVHQPGGFHGRFGGPGFPYCSFFYGRSRGRRPRPCEPELKRDAGEKALSSGVFLRPFSLSGGLSGPGGLTVVRHPQCWTTFRVGLI